MTAVEWTPEQAALRDRILGQHGTAPAGTRRCAGCEQTKPLAEFSRDRGNPTGYGYRCLACNRTSPTVYAQQAARRRLIAAHKAEYDRYYAEEKERLR